MADEKKPSGVEVQKAASRRLRGDIAGQLAAPEARGGISEIAYSLLKFHGLYQHYDRDSATALKQKGRKRRAISWSAPGSRRASSPRRSIWRWTTSPTGTAAAICASPPARASSSTACSRAT